MRYYCIDAEIEVDDRDYFYEVIGSMDVAYLNFKAEKLKASSSK